MLVWDTVPAGPNPALAESHLQEAADKGGPGLAPAPLVSLPPQAAVPTGPARRWAPVKALDSKSSSRFAQYRKSECDRPAYKSLTPGLV